VKKRGGQRIKGVGRWIDVGKGRGVEGSIGEGDASRRTWIVGVRGGRLTGERGGRVDGRGRSGMQCHKVG